ncbi:hypothetical protein FBEOM_10257 [Fusarium beomiforme]|uniref:Uncharacterized protein n=1 Tax=Fusarium beomiforme TaxID=44412 RepID=A0A9P5AC35_9HYPO|nr:hypothetical protein FBEOM_10257 [Fusarium beomiforme]
MDVHGHHFNQQLQSQLHIPHTKRNPAMANKYVTQGLPAAPEISLKTLPMAGLLVDIYGLDELPPNVPVSCLWLLHPRTRSRETMNDIARRTVGAWGAHAGANPKRGLIALTFDMPNHGTRMVSESANHPWSKGNTTHALDMFGMVKGGVSDMSGLMDLVSGYLGLEIDGHVCLGWSLGGHGAWQAFFGEERIDAAVVIIGCPDFTGLMCGRAAGSKLDCGTDFIGSKYFPKDLIEICSKHDPKAVCFGTSPIPSSLSSAEQTRLRAILDERVRGKKLLLCSGGDDELVPYANTKDFATLLKDAVGEKGWYRDGGLEVDDRVYEGIGHKFSPKMVEDAVQFLVNAVERRPRNKAHVREGEKSVL